VGDTQYERDLSSRGCVKKIFVCFPVAWQVKLSLAHSF